MSFAANEMLVHVAVALLPPPIARFLIGHFEACAVLVRAERNVSDPVVEVDLCVSCIRN